MSEVKKYLNEDNVNKALIPFLLFQTISGIFWIWNQLFPNAFEFAWHKIERTYKDMLCIFLADPGKWAALQTPLSLNKWG